jgi:hypothetical protein
VFSLRISVHEPTDLFDPERSAAAGCVAVSACIGEKDAPATFVRMCHFIRDTDYGREMRSRFRLGEIESRDPNHPISPAEQVALRRAKLNTELGRRLHQPATEEMSYLAEMPPTLYRRETLDNIF